jgi:hypothetical protein
MWHLQNNFEVRILYIHINNCFYIKNEMSYCYLCAKLLLDGGGGGGGGGGGDARFWFGEFIPAGAVCF